MASSSSSAPSSQSPKKYVFISFRGEDTRLNFTSHLYHALCGQKIYAYIDDSLEKGDEVWPSLEKAIEDSTLFLVVFSENYASSTWCLKELAKILECCRNQRHLLIPVFYRVDPSDVRKQRGSYHEAFEGHERKSSINTQQLRQWREALTHAANLSGWHCSPDRLRRTKVFIVLDDVDNAEQLENLVGRCEFGSGCSDPKIRELAEEVTKYAGGSTLALKGRIEGMVMNLSEVEETSLRNKLNSSCMKFLSRNLMDWIGPESLPATFEAESLVRLEMLGSRLTRLWDGV
ncbi:TMV resistance protein N-like [Neltuma alba]|uniref:TMV resistance protein N-like n=1 Tax=Neltuma alba TaxID=207710 RepID=UPI0010A40FA6|nr:TMV resistance protein N-like [Prosopis alba]